MAVAKSDYLEDALINHVLRNTAYTSPATLYLAAFTAAPSDAGGGTEVSGVNYARQAITFDAPSPPGTTQNSADILFPVAGAGGWGTITHVGIFDAATAGNLLYWGAVDSPQLIDVNQQLKVAAGGLTITED